ncbi:hypothetical protein X975_25645, partial [Stegodyphus mimosarum]
MAPSMMLLFMLSPMEQLTKKNLNHTASATMSRMTTAPH